MSVIEASRGVRKQGNLGELNQLLETCRLLLLGGFLNTSKDVEI